MRQPLLQQELEQLKSDSDTSGNLLMQMLKVDPAQLESFLSAADRAFHNSNALLTAPGKEQGVLREKLDGVFRELHTVKGEAAALGLEGFARRIHAAEDILSDLRTRTELKGSDFVSVVTHLDELISHAAELTEAGLDPETLRAERDLYAGSMQDASRALFSEWLDGLDR